ncbi:MAG: hypothetical protein M3238_07040 [Actinomycetota bacterium]|nr:hypothetical protein [Actinomycetota bacterium]
MQMIEVRLEADATAGPELSSFYLDRLGFEGRSGSDGTVEVAVGETNLRFAAGPPGAAPFYHFALLVPGDRFAAAHTWLRERVTLLPDTETGETIFDFSNWDALACYCLDPAGNIVELIAHRGLGETGADATFDAAELLGFSEMGVVGGDKTSIATTLAEQLDLHVWDGTLRDPERLAFIGERGRTLILCPTGRPWLPTDRPSEVWPVDMLLRGARSAVADLPDTPHRLAVRSPA